MIETSRESDPHKLGFFEIFSSSAAHKFHLEQDYMQRMFTALEGKLAGAPVMTNLNALQRSRRALLRCLGRCHFLHRELASISDEA
jgi:hypothetical protein